MVGEFQGKRFEVGSVYISESNNDSLYGEPMFTIFGKIPAFDKDAGQPIYLTTLYKSASKAEQFVTNLNSI